MKLFTSLCALSLVAMSLTGCCHSRYSSGYSPCYSGGCATGGCANGACGVSPVSPYGIPQGSTIGPTGAVQMGQPTAFAPTYYNNGYTSTAFAAEPLPTLR